MIRESLLPLFRSRLVLLGALLVVNAGLFLGVLRPAASQSSTRQDTLRHLQARVYALRQEEHAQRSVLVSWRQAEAYAAGFPDRGRLLALADRIQRAGAQLALKIPSIDYRPDAKQVDEAPLSRITIALRVEGPYGAVRRFIYELETLRRYVVVDKLSLRGRPTEGRVQLALELSAYVR